MAAETQTIRLVVSDDNSFARETAERLQYLLEQASSGFLIEKVGASSLSTASSGPARLVITVGDGAWTSADNFYGRDTPVLAVMPSHGSFDVTTKKPPRNSSAIYPDQPIERMLNLVSILKPDQARVAAVLGPNTVALSSMLQSAGNERKQRVHLETVVGEGDVGRVIAKAIRDADVLLAIPDPTVHNVNTVQSILLMSYRASIPVIGYSAAYQRAGAMVALYSTPEQLARQAAEVVLAYREGKPLPAPQQARYFTVGINTTVARSLGIALPAADVMEQKLRSMKE